MAVNPKSVHQAVKVALALANPTVAEKDWIQLKDRFQLEDHVYLGVRKLVDACRDEANLKLVISCLVF